MSESSGGVDFEARLDARQQLANDLSIAVERGDVSQMSCAFLVARDEWDSREENRTIHQFRELLDISAVTYPASPTTTLQIAQRLALEVPIESRTRLRRLYVEMRSGKVLSAREQQLVTAMLGQFEVPGPVRYSGAIHTAEDLRQEMARLEHSREGSATVRKARASARTRTAEDLDRAVAELKRKRRRLAR